MVRRHIYRNTLGLILIALFVGTIFGSAIVIESAQAASVISLKWSAYIGPWMTEVSPLSADLFGNGQQEIVLTGGPPNWGTTGAVTVLNGTNGRTIWQVNSTRIPNIGIDGHTTFDVLDLNKDGLPEIVVYGLNGPLVLNGTNGNLIWRNTLAVGGNVYGAAVDVDGDGYPEIFVSRGNGPYVGYDAVTELDHNGNILHQAFSWHPCWGGITVADPAGDGHFKIFQGDRSNSYSASGNPYTGGGLGIHCLDANTLTQLWSDPTVLCSSQAPILADVNHDGVLDVIVADQTTDGVVVLNSTDGSVLTTGGIYRKGPTNMPAHSTPTVADLHGDGKTLELVDCDGSVLPDQPSYPQIWDLTNWRLDGFIPQNCSEPPKAGNVTGGSTLDLITVAGGTGETGGGNSVYIYSYDQNSKTYVQRGTAVTGLSYVRAFTLVQDVDRDGLNELVLSSDSGMVYCYGTPAKVSNPMVRSGLTFYSEDKCGAAVYVPPAIPSQPVLLQEMPVDRSVNQSLSPTLSVLVTSFQGYSLTVWFTGTDSFGTWNNIGGAINGQSGVFSVTASSMSKTGTQYYWNVTALDSHGNRASSNYTFTTYSNPPNQAAPLLSSSNNGDLTCFNQSTSDPDGNGVTNIYNWNKDGTSVDTLYLTFDTRTSNNPMSSDVLFADGFENGFNLWSANGATNWNRDTSQVHSGSYSVHAAFGDTYLTSNNIDTSSAGGITVSFWYRKHNIGDADSVYLQFWNGAVYKNIFQLRNPNSENTWQFYSFQTYDPEYYVSNFRLRFVANSISSTGKDIWVDDVSVTVPTRTMDYSGHNNLGTVHGTTWTSAGVVGGAETFDGGTDYIRVNDNPSLGGSGTWSAISLEVWVKLSTAQNGTTIMAKKVGSSKYASYMIGFASSGSPSNTLLWGINNDSAINKTQTVWDNTNTTLNVGQWYYIVCTYQSGPGLTIYINGIPKTNMPLTGNIMPSPGTSIYNQPLYIGWDGRTASSWFNGGLDEIMIYPRALTQQEIMQQYLQSKDGFSNVSTIVSQETNLGEKWNCTITPNDSFRDGIPKTSNTVTALGGGPQPPVISAPSPTNGAIGIPTSLSTLSFTLTDYQGKPMNYTVTTTPNILVGAGIGANVPNGTYNVAISGLANSTTYSWVVTATDGTLSNNATYNFNTASGNWWNSSWNYRTSITIDHTKVFANLTNFPMLVDVIDSNLSTHAQANGNDIVLVDSTGNKLNHEIESYNPSNGHLTAWVNIPNLSSASNTLLWMYYGNPTVANQQNTNGVWDQNFLMVQHLNESSGIQYDSTSNHNDGTPTGAINEGTTGKIGGGDQFTGGHISDPQLYNSQTQFTFSAWIYPQAGARYFVSEWANYQGAFLQVFSDSQVQFYINGIWVSKPVSLNQWHYVVATYDGTTARLWVDGGSAASVSAPSLTWGSQKMYIGDRYDNTRQFIGFMDEVRASSIPRSNEWINTEYANQNNLSSFYTIGAEVSYPG